VNVVLTGVFSIKPGRVCIILAGRHAGKKAVVVKQFDEGKKVIDDFSCVIGQEIPSCLGCWSCKGPTKNHQEDGKEENRQEIQGKAIRQICELQSHDAH
jgi:hypothetical protein